MAHKLRPILLVDDSVADVELTLESLREDARIVNQIDVAHDGEDALDYLYGRGNYKNRPRIKPSVIMLDLKMPKVDGFEVLKIIKRDKDLMYIPIVILSSSKETRDIARSYKNGANAFMEKPVDSEKFKDAIKHLGIFWGVLNIAPDSQ